jgi:N-acetylmuramoyl-L-alanine amidase
MRRTWIGLCAACAATLTLSVPATAVPAPVTAATAITTTITAAPAVAAVTTSATVVAPRALGPVPSTWEGGKPVLVAPRWWPKGTRYASAPWPAAWPRPVRFVPTKRGALSGLVVALDPGHDLGNGRHTSAINATYWVGLWKSCNTTGTATNGGFAEATYNFDVVARLRRLLVASGATVVVTRDRNTVSTYGPCVGARGAFGVQEKARLMVQVHADGAPSKGHGFHVIAPAYYRGYTDDIYRSSGVLAGAMVRGMRARGFVPATYLSRVVQVRKDQGGLNSSEIPTITVETLNMRNAADSRIATTAAGRQRVASGLFRGIANYYLGR